MSSIHVRNLRKSFPNPNNDQGRGLEVLGAIDLDVADGEFVSFFGPNGCGKTTFLMILAGLLESSEGTVNMDAGKSHKPKVGFIFQDYRESLYPWLRNIDNVAFPLQLHGMGKEERRKQAQRLLNNLGINVPHDGYPYQLSGGERQLLSIARALIFEVDALLMDEPFASLDYTTRFYVRDRVQEIWMRTRTTTLLVSHNIEEAIYLADRVVLVSQKPMRILDVIDVPLPRPRKAGILEDVEFFQIQSYALRVFKEEMAR